MTSKAYFHQPVLLTEVQEYLGLKPGKNIIDATLGGGGYSKAILGKIGQEGKLLGIDLDRDAVENQKSENRNKNFILDQGNFAEIDKIVKYHEFPTPDGIVADLGLSSYELDQAGRGMSFQKKEILDMRFDQSQAVDARFILNNFEGIQLTEIFNSYGEEKFSRQIVKRIIEYKKDHQEIKFTTDLLKIIESALPKPIKHKVNDHARRIFQALRIEVNHELENLKKFLPKAFELVKLNGRLVIVSFHSLEDRIVKEFFNKLSKGCVCPVEFPICKCGQRPTGRILTKKPITASIREINLNTRAKAAKLRAIEKISC